MGEAAVRIDRTTGVEERLEYLPTPRGRLYTWAARPRGARSCVLICSPVLGDFTANYHRERLLGRALMSRDFGVIRFHYAGEGNSEGERRDMTFPSMCTDARAVLDHAALLGFSEFCVLGTRIGALVASVIVATESWPLAIWEPVTDPLQILADAQRAKRISQTASLQAKRDTGRDEDLEQDGVLDLLGYDVHPPLIDSLGGVDLLTALGSQPRPVFLARFGDRGSTNDPLAEGLAARGFAVTSGRFRLKESWWFHDELEPASDDLLHTTTAWLSDKLSDQG